MRLVHGGGDRAAGGRAAVLGVRGALLRADPVVHDHVRAVQEAGAHTGHDRVHVRLPNHGHGLSAVPHEQLAVPARGGLCAHRVLQVSSVGEDFDEKRCGDDGGSDQLFRTVKFTSLTAILGEPKYIIEPTKHPVRMFPCERSRDVQTGISCARKSYIIVRFRFNSTAYDDNRYSKREQLCLRRPRKKKKLPGLACVQE